LRFEIKKGDVLITKDSESWDDIAVPAMVAEDFSGVLCGYHLAIIRSLPGAFHAGYLFRLFCSEMLNYQFKIEANGITRFGLPAAAIDNALLLRPPLSEQELISEYIDRETARIDALIEKKRRLLEMLEKKRLAVITHGITKGLDPNAPMKDSGIDWLGKAPAHWGVRKVKYSVSDVVDCLHTTPHYDGDLVYPAVRTADLERGKLLLEQVRLVSEEVYLERIQRMKPEAGDIVYSREGERFGMAALVPSGVDLCLGQRMMMFRVKPDVDSAYFMWAMNSEAIYQQVILYTGGATSPHINIRDIINFSIPHPPLHEQSQIGQYIDRECAQIDGVAKKIAAAMASLSEYRSALITNAITGKIDVRGEAEKEAAA
jgi:type I restriction enzyme S subunit